MSFFMRTLINDSPHDPQKIYTPWPEAALDPLPEFQMNEAKAYTPAAGGGRRRILPGHRSLARKSSWSQKIQGNLFAMSWWIRRGLRDPKQR